MKSKIVFIILLLVFILIAGLVFYFPPHHNAYYPKCIFKLVTSLECPGCGSARSIYSLLHGHIQDALDYNTLLVLFVPVILVGVLASFSLYFKNLLKYINHPKIYLGLILVFWIVRNINYFPFIYFHSDK